MNVLNALTIVNVFNELNHRSETAHCCDFCHLLIPVPRAMMRLIVEAHNCRVYLSNTPADVRLSAEFVALSHSVITPSEVSMLRVRARTTIALDTVLAARSKLLNEEYFTQRGALYDDDFDIPDMRLSESLRYAGCDERRRWTGSILSAIRIADYGNARVADCDNAHAALHYGLDNIYWHILCYVPDSFDYETNCAFLEGLSTLGEIAFPSLRTARKCLDNAFTFDTRERHAEAVFVRRLRRDGLCLRDATGFLYPERVENALNALSEFPNHM